MAGTLAIVSQKGGVGKTTTAINLAAALAMRGVKTLLIDADPQGAVRFGLGLFRREHRRGLSDYIAERSEMHEVVHPSMLPWLGVVPSGTISDDGDHESYPRQLADSRRLPELLARARERGYVVVIDTPPGLGPISSRVLNLSDRALVPLQCEPLALQTTSQILRGIRGAALGNPTLSFDGVLLTMFEPGNETSEQVASFVRAQLPHELVLDVMIPRTAASMEAFASGQPIVARTPNDDAARAYSRLADLLTARLQ